MDNPLHHVETAIAKRVNETVHQASEKLYQRIEQLSHETVTRSHLEAILADAILQTLSHLARRYWGVLAGGIVGILVFQAALLKVILHESQDCVAPLSWRSPASLAESPSDRIHQIK